MSRPTIQAAGVLLIAWVCCAVAPAHTATRPEGVLTQGQAALAATRGEAFARVALAEVARAAGRTDEAVEHLLKASAAAGHSSQAPAVHELAAWRLLAAQGPEARKHRADVLGRLRQMPGSRWLGVFELSELAAARAQPAVLVKQAALVQPPAAFPTALGEEAHRAILLAVGVGPDQAAMTVISRRSYEPLYVLRDLDRALTRESEFLTLSGQGPEASALLAARNRLREGYLAAATTVVERLFALRLAGREAQCDALAARAAKLAYLTDADALAGVLGRLGPANGRTLVLEPLLRNELKFLDSPPDLAALPESRTAAIRVKARAKAARPDGTAYEGAVEVTLDPLTLRCDRATVAPGAAAVQGDGRVVLGGIPGYSRAAADRFTLATEAGTLMLEGNVRLEQPGAVLKFTRCTLSLAGQLSGSRSLLDDFAAAADVPARLALLPAIAKVYADEELPAGAQYLLALTLLEGRLSWHAPAGPGGRQAARNRATFKIAGAPDRWSDAHAGEPWMLSRLGEPARKRLRAEQEAVARAWGVKEAAAAYWRIDDPSHADVARALRLLDRAARGGAEPGPTAARWAREVRRNNTVVTFDVCGGYRLGQDAPVVMDVRNAGTVSLALYRITRAEQLVDAAGTIGEDFIYRDYGLPNVPRGPEMALSEMQMEEMARQKPIRHRLAPAPEELVWQGQCDPARLKALPLWLAAMGAWGAWDGDDDGYFGDGCGEFAQRLAKGYARDDALSAWAIGRIVNVPAAALAKEGAYLLVARANGQTASAPIVVEPLSLALRRCRDGVMAAVSDTDGVKPVEGARIVADQMVGPAVTDREGVAFARVFAGGTRAIVAQKDGRFAVGGFGKVFDGIYQPFDRQWERGHRGFDRLGKVRAWMEEAAVYPDRHVVAAYTDRPTYRPGQEVNFKLILRRLKAAAGAGGKARSFRQEDFDVAGNLELPRPDAPVSYEVMDSRRRVVASGQVTLNDFGTAAAKLQLGAEAATGSYTLIVNPGGRPLVVPDAFQVKYYRRVTFELTVSGAPETLAAPGRLEIRAAGKYYFGKPLAGGTLQASLVLPQQWRPLAQGQGVLNAQGAATVALDVPAAVPAGRYVLLCVLSDATGRAVTRQLPVAVTRAGAAAPAGGLAAPRFAPFDQPLAVRTGAAEVAVERVSGKAASKAVFASAGGAATVKFPEPGWYRLTAGADKAEVFAYGGVASPEALGGPGGFVNLTHYAGETLEPDGGDEASDEFDRPYHLRALIGANHARVGESLRVLVYVPSGSARVLFTVEGETVADYLTVTVGPAKGSRYHVVEIPIKARYLPNFYLQGRLLWHSAEPTAREPMSTATLAKQAADPELGEDPRWCRVDVEAPEGQIDREGLKVTVQPEREGYRPGEAAYVQVRVADLAGKPVEAEVSLAAVDESVHEFGGDSLGALARAFADPRPPRRFVPKAWRAAVGREPDRALAAEVQRKALREMVAAAEAAMAAPRGLAVAAAGPASLAAFGQMPAGRVAMGRLRADFRETATWQPQLRTGADGLLRTSFVLPESLTAYRLSAVGLTRDTRIGTARGGVKATRPLAVQVALPRFLVQRDRLAAVGTIHNNGPKARTVMVEWDVAGAAVELPEEKRGEWVGMAENERTRISRKVEVAGGASVQVEAWLRADRAGEAKVSFRASDGAGADGETRSVGVLPMGRARDVAIREPFVGKRSVTLPVGFAPRGVRVAVCRAEVAGALTGLEYLVDYPYGCVEQTMSRFGPAVMVKQTAALLPAKVEAMLPEVLARGLARLAAFQHADGGWGWWEADATDDAMTVYVVYGLARCKGAGTGVDEGMLARGCERLRGRLRAGALAGELAARAHLAMALAGRADGKELAAFAEAALAAGKPSGRVLATTALACRQAGLTGLGERLWGACGNWRPEGAEDLALKLRGETAFGADLAECRRTTARLLDLRSGYHWGHTRATAAALEALAEMTRYAPPGRPARGVHIRVAGKAVLDVQDAAALAAPVHRVDVPDVREGAQIEVAFDSDEAAVLLVTASGTQRQDAAEPSGTEVKVTRRYVDLAGKPIDRPVKVGEVFAVKLKLDLARPQSYLILEDLRPAGCEFADERLEGPAAAHVEFRDNRLSVFHTSLAAGAHEFVYYLRAETPGTTHVLPGCAYPMYSPAARGETAGGRLEVLR